MRETPAAVMLFAAGFGTRMRPLTDTCPKPLISVAGQPLIDHALDHCKAIAPKRIVANLHYLPEQLETHLHGTDVFTLREEPDILDTGGGLLNALPHLQANPVFTLNPDAIWSGPNPLAVLATQWDPGKMDALLCLVPIAQTEGYSGQGDFAKDTNGRLTRGREFVYGGAQILNTDRLAGIGKRIFSLNVLWDVLQQDGRLFGCVYPGRWCDVGHPDGIVAAEKLLVEAPDV